MWNLKLCAGEVNGHSRKCGLITGRSITLSFVMPAHTRTMVDNHAYSHRRRRYTLFLNQEWCLFVAEVLTHREAATAVNGFRLVSLRIEPKRFYQAVSDRLRLSKHLHI